MIRRTAFFILFLSAFIALPTAQQAEKLDYAAIGQIRDEGLNRSQVMDTLFWLTDRYGPRVTGTPAIDEAGAWTMKQMTGWGLANVHREDWDFGRGWSIVRFSAHLIEPQIQPLIGLPKTWSTGTGGPVTADVVRAAIATDADFAKYKGQLKGKIVLAQPLRAVRMLEGPFIVKMDGELAKEAETTPIPAQRGRGGRGGAGRGPSADQRRAAPAAWTRLNPIGPRVGAQQFVAACGSSTRMKGRGAFDRGSDAAANMGSGQP